MLKKTIFAATALIFLFVTTGAALALDLGNKRKGKYTYRKVFKACMERGEVESAKPSVNPDSKTQAQWTRVFENKDFEQFGCSQEWGQLSEQELMDIYAYLHGSAADSPTPAKCK